MNEEILQPQNPQADSFLGRSMARRTKRLFFATRPKFLTASTLPVLVGTAWGVHAAGPFDGWVFFLALVATVCVHAGSNVLNDVSDDDNGTDRQNQQRIYPYTGGSRFIQQGILSAATMFRLGWGLMSIAAGAGVILFLLKGPMILLLGLAGMALGLLYSLGPVRLSAIGLGETAVALAFGVLPVMGAAWLQGAVPSMEMLLFSLPVSAWVAAILLINEVPDRAADGAVGKRTLPVRLGLAGTARVYLALQLAATAAIVVLTVMGALPLLSPVLPLVLLVPGVRAFGAIRTGMKDRRRMTGAIQATLAIHACGSLWLCAVPLFLLFRATG